MEKFSSSDEDFYESFINFNGFELNKLMPRDIKLAT